MKEDREIKLYFSLARYATVWIQKMSGLAYTHFNIQFFLTPQIE